MKKDFVLFLLWVVLGCGLIHAQSGQLARNYADQGEYEKAILLYQKALRTERGNPKLLAELVKSYQQIEQYEEAEAELKSYLSKVVDKGFLLVELGYNEQLRGNDSLATQFYARAIEGVVNNSMNTHRVATTFQSHSLLEQAVAAYEAGAKANVNANYNIQLAKLYGELGQVKNMYDAYLNLINKNPNYAAVAQRTFAIYINEDPLNDANIIFRKTILKRLQTEQNVLYNELLSWLFIQQKEYHKAFVQEKAIYRRTDGSFNGLVNLADIAIEEKEYEAAEEILLFLKENIVNEDVEFESEQKLLQIAIIKAVTTQDKELIKSRFETLLQKPDIALYAVPIQVNYAHFVAFDMDKPDEAFKYLREEVKKPRNRFDEARLKMELADILVLKEKFNQALIYYSQIQNKIKNNLVSQEARFKVAKTSYYKGDFDWAEQQLDVLKRGNTQLIANDALELLLVIRDNSMDDSLQTALKKYARADLLTYQNKPDEAIQLYENILEEHKGEKIEDEALLAQAKLHESKNAFAKAEKNYLTIIAYYSDGILADDAHYRLARLYEGPLNNTEKAKEHYERIIFDLADSIYYVEAQKRFRNLRGDAIN
ncbi:tetratricopeptide repeat protein [Dokdonia sp. Hel_I_53]|uniref:tetratricopeptide repeat protein n=1 Tax=Dokdonia sp. Hel_I_53 TaxID=1566287 RepID=UPI00119BD6FA|nr:tetratricopeptide repeat protein [Dokdonia sp. Hel_I_53]TVZ52499.1 tetratricopeptide repeat protein [Dokdonia sp. Hel_I_53]